MITIAMLEKYYEKAKKIGNREEFLNNDIIQEKMAIIAIQKMEAEEANEKKYENSSSQKAHQECISKQNISKSKTIKRKRVCNSKIDIKKK